MLELTLMHLPSIGGLYFRTGWEGGGFATGPRLGSMFVCEMCVAQS